VEPSSSLRHLAYCFWELHSDDSITQPFTYTVVADGCIDIFFDIRNFEDIYMMGYCKGHVSFDLGSSFHYIGIRFLPGIFPIISNIQASDLSDQVVLLKDLLPSLEKVLLPYAQVKSGGTFLFSNLDSALQTFIPDDLQLDERFTDALLTILKSKGHLESIESISSGISPRQLRRLFAKYIGTSPKNFCRLIRFQHILYSQFRSPKVSTTFYLDAAYYDQAHFIKDFRNFYGITPHEALSRSKG